MKLIKFIAVILFFTGCSVDPEIIPITQVDNIKEIIPEGWPVPHYNFSNNPLTPDGFILGKTLFYDPILSSDNSISCGSCHQQFGAFSNAGHDLSHGVNSQLGKRNSPALQNLNWQSSFFHDGGVTNFEVFPLSPIVNPVEMNETIANVISKISKSEKYKPLLTKAYGDNIVTSQRLFKALAQFMGTMYSYNGKYDQVKKGLATYTAIEQNGYTLFRINCSSCHQEPLFSDFSFRDVGIPVNPAYMDSGRMHITKNIADIYKFKTPSLRNIEKSGPYMHDGRFKTLDECMEHYNYKIINGPILSSNDKIEIIAFLKTLTDLTFLNDKRFSEK